MSNTDARFLTTAWEFFPSIILLFALIPQYRNFPMGVNEQFISYINVGGKFKLLQLFCTG